MASADIANVQEQLRTQASEVMRTQALLQALSNQKLPANVLLGPQADLIQNPAIQAQLQSEWQDIRAKLGKLRCRSHPAPDGNRHRQTKLEASLPMAQAREADFKQLVDQGYISGHATQDKTRIP